ncbi:MAG: hypothetical protein WCP14_02235 [bacterium]
MKSNNEKLFTELRSLRLPLDEYIVVASGPMGIRGLRTMKDVDILVSDDLWEELENKYDIFYEHDAVKIRLSENVEAMCQASFGGVIRGSFTSAQQIAEKEIIGGLPFQNIQTTLYFKKQGTRDKDKNDVHLIEEWLENNIS